MIKSIVMARVPTLNALIAPTCIAVLVGLAWPPAAHGQSSSSGAAMPVAADAAFGPWQPPPRRVPLAQATPADFDAAFVYGSFQSMDRPRLALLLASGGRKHDRVIELDDQGRWREFRQMTQFTPLSLIHI